MDNYILTFEQRMMVTAFAILAMFLPEHITDPSEKTSRIVTYLNGGGSTFISDSIFHHHKTPKSLHENG